MKKTATITLLGILLAGSTYAQRFIKINEDDRRFWINVGTGPGFLKAGQA